MNEPSLKPISREGVPAALQKAHRYRILNDPTAAESICLDVLAAEPGNDESLLRWNACVRILRGDPEFKPLEAEAWTPDLE